MLTNFDGCVVGYPPEAWTEIEAKLGQVKNPDQQVRNFLRFFLGGAESVSVDGQGRVLGGAVLGSQALMEGVYTFLRTAGPTLSAFNAWIILKGMETLAIRMDAHSKNALALAQWLETQPAVARVLYPGLPSHPQHELAMRQQTTGGGIVAFELKGGQAAAWKLIDATRMLSITANLGDTKTTITHPATTTHARMTPEQRAAAGIGDGLVRIAAGLESIADIKADLARGLA